MNVFDFPILSLITFLPLIGGVFILFLPRENKELIRIAALGITVADFILSLFLLTGFSSTTAEMQFVEKKTWINAFGAYYHIGIDGISLFMVILTTFLTAICVLASWSYIQKKVKEYMFAFLFLSTGMIGVFVALDLLLFYLFWEAMLIPMYLIIGVWGGERRIYAALKFFLFTMVGSVLMLVAILVLYVKSGGTTFDLIAIYGIFIPAPLQKWLFLAFALAFAIKVPMFPFHTWLPDAHVEAPTAGSVILAGVLLKMGTYGFLRFCLPLFPEACHFFLVPICVLAIIGIIYGALVAMVQKDVKKLVAYSSVSHLGFVMLGIFAFNAEGMSGGILHMINHGLSTGALFLIVGMLYERRHTRMISDFGGLWKSIPVFSAFFLIVTLSSIGLPGLNGFVGEFLVLVGAFKAKPLFGILAASGVILAAVYMLWMFQRVIFGEITHEANRGLKDLNLRETVVLLPILVMIFWIGIYPNTFLSRMQTSIDHLLTISQKHHTPLTVKEMAQADPSEADEMRESPLSVKQSERH